MQKILHLSFTGLRFDERVKRAITCGKENGYIVNILAPGVGIPEIRMSLRRKFIFGVNYSSARLLGAAAIRNAFWRIPPHQQTLQDAMALKPDLIHSHDWDTLPIAAELKKQLGIPIIYDTHEYAKGMHYERFAWRHVMSPTIFSLEKTYIHSANQIVTVSDGLASQLCCDYGLSELPAVVRNLPNYQIPNSSSGDAKLTQLYYHGALARGRGIEAMLEALSRLPDSYLLSLVGPERQPGFVRSINKQAKKLGVSHKLKIEGPVAPAILIERAAQADIGICVLGDENPHYNYALPNKIFEYMMAGLFVVVGKGADVTKVVASSEAGAVFDGGDMASFLKGISRETIEETRKRNLKTATGLNWNIEQIKLAEIYCKLLSA